MQTNPSLIITVDLSIKCFISFSVKYKSTHNRVVKGKNGILKRHKGITAKYGKQLILLLNSHIDLEKYVPICRSQWPLAYCNYEFESHRRHECFSVVSVVCCQVEVSATG
jgi:hypothetical protein